MEETKAGIIEAEYKEVEKGTDPERAAEQEGPKVVAELTIRVLDNGAFELNIPEDSQQLSTEQAEAITRSVHEQLRDTRVAALAIEMFKARLG